MKGQLTFDSLGKLGALEREEFYGNAYQLATNASVAFGDAKPAAAEQGDKKRAAVNVDMAKVNDKENIENSDVGRGTITLSTDTFSNIEVLPESDSENANGSHAEATAANIQYTQMAEV